MRMTLRLPILALGLALLVAAPAYAKLQIEKIVISGNGLKEPLEVRDGGLLALSNPYTGRFAQFSNSSSARFDGVPAYEVTLFARVKESPEKPAELKPVYHFRYAPGENGRRGHVYLPGKGDPWFKENASIIFREGHDGHWHTAAARWESGMKHVLGRE